MKWLRTVALAGLAAGTLDILFAFVNNHAIGPVRVLQAVASGLLGRDAYQGGLGAAATGLAAHFLLAFGFATIYFFLARPMRFPLRYWLQAGIVYGLMVFVVMTYIVVPLSRAAIGGPPDLTVAALWKPLLAHTAFFGVPIAFVTARRVPGLPGRHM